MGIPFVLLSQANAEAFWPSDRTAELCRRVFPSALRCFFVSEANRRLFEDQIALTLPNAEIVRNPFKVPFGGNAEWPASSSGEPLRLACVARLEAAAKGQDILIRVFSQARWQNRPIEVRFYGDGPNRESLQRLAAQYGLGNRASFMGHVADISAIWRGNHALILPSRLEGLPIALVEASLCSRIAIATPVGGIAEVIRDNETGFLAAAANDAHFDEALERAWRRCSDWRRLGQQARERIQRLFPERPEETFARRLVDLAGHTIQPPRTRFLPLSDIDNA